jgi:hypothetical protein
VSKPIDLIMFSGWHVDAVPVEVRSPEVRIDLFDPEQRCRLGKDPAAVFEHGKTLAQTSPTYDHTRANLGNKWETNLVNTAQDSDPRTAAETYIRETDGKIVTDVPESAVRTEFDTAITLAHEEQHAKDIAAGWTVQGLAPVAGGEKQYVALMWELEDRAFRAELTFMDELVASDPALARCREVATNLEEWMRTPAGPARDAILAQRKYLESQERLRWEKFHDGPKDPTAQQLVNSLPMSQIVNRWAPQMSPAIPF